MVSIHIILIKHNYNRDNSFIFDYFLLSFKIFLSKINSWKQAACFTHLKNLPKAACFQSENG
nr:hypothetical protein [uncultured archaeon]AQS32528.1 hypothetical protein [uncultured archaeon]